MKAQTLLGRHPAALGDRVVAVDVLEDLQDMKALGGKAPRHVHEPPSSVGHTIGQKGPQFRGQVAGQGVAHLDRPQLRRTLLEQIKQVLAGVLVPGKE